MSGLAISLLDWDVSRYQQLTYDLADPTLDLFAFDGRRRLESWRTLSVVVADSLLERPDLWRPGGAEMLVLADDLAPRLAPTFGDDVELLPVTFEEEDFRIVNVCNVVDCLDRASSRFGTLAMELSFDPSRVPADGFVPFGPREADRRQ